MQMASTVRNMSDSLFNYAQQLKIDIVKEADGDGGDPLNIKNKENLEAAGNSNVGARNRARTQTF